MNEFKATLATEGTIGENGFGLLGVMGNGLTHGEDTNGEMMRG